MLWSWVVGVRDLKIVGGVGGNLEVVFGLGGVVGLDFIGLGGVFYY